MAGRPGNLPCWEGEALGAFLFPYLDSGESQPSMGEMTRLSLKPSEYRELSWKVKLNPCSSLLMMCTVSLASRPEEGTPALRRGLRPAPQASQQMLLCCFSSLFHAPWPWTTSLPLALHMSLLPWRGSSSHSGTRLHPVPAPARWLLCLSHSSPGIQVTLFFSPLLVSSDPMPSCLC